METGGDENRTHHIFQKKWLGGFRCPRGLAGPFPGAGAIGPLVAESGPETKGDQETKRLRGPFGPLWNVGVAADSIRATQLY